MSAFKNNELLEAIRVHPNHGRVRTYRDNEGDVQIRERKLAEAVYGKDQVALAFRYAEMRRSRFRWFLAAVAGWTAAAIGWCAFWMVTR